MTQLYTAPYDPEAIYHPNSPLDPMVIEDAVFTLIRNTEIDPTDPPSVNRRRMYAALRGLAELHPRCIPELMLGVQAISAYHAANAAWRRSTRPGDQKRHIATAAAAARAFDSMLRAVERRQVKPLSVPIGRPPPRVWAVADPAIEESEWERRLGLLNLTAVADPVIDSSWPDDEIITALSVKAQQWEADPNEGLDIANTAGILPDGSIFVPRNPTEQQSEYMERRLSIKYVRERAQNLRNGISTPIHFGPLRVGDLIH